MTTVPAVVVGQQVDQESTETIQVDWIEALNNSNSLKSFYLESSGLMLANTLFIGIEGISNQLMTFTSNIGKISSYRTLEEHQLRDNQKFVLGEYITDGEKVFSTIIGWKWGDRWTKEFEVISKNHDDFTPEIDSVNLAREKWQQFANQHRPDLIVEEVFSESGKYFNRGNQSVGKEIVKAYSYMDNESYNIALEPLKVLQINWKIIFEIGIFRAGGEGLYTLIWGKEDDAWKLLLDFNF